MVSGLVSPVKNQFQCGSCTAFASIAAVETCFCKVTGVVGYYSEQQLIDCGYGHYGAAGCNGAPAHAYLGYFANVRRGAALAAEAQYPYLNVAPKLRCPSDMPMYHQGAKLNASYYTYSGTETLLRSLVYMNGAVLSAIYANFTAFHMYRGGGVFDSCPRSPTQGTRKPTHAITVVGYGTENGTDYWLLKNSWGIHWGENGYIKLRRGTGACGIGRTIVIVTCQPEAGPVNAEVLVPDQPCFDVYSNCPDLAVTSCYIPDIASNCVLSCGLCQGLVPAESNTCYDAYSNCPLLAQTLCYDADTSKNCLKSCGLCPGLTPAPSYTCYDAYSNCGQLAATSCFQPDIATKCLKSCGLCRGMTPASSYTCYDYYLNCPVLADTSCYLNSTAANCGRSCGLCPGMTPVLSVTCYDLYTNCADLAATSCYLQESGSFKLSLPFIYHSF